MASAAFSATARVLAVAAEPEQDEEQTEKEEKAEYAAYDTAYERGIIVMRLSGGRIKGSERC